MKRSIFLISVVIVVFLINSFGCGGGGGGTDSISDSPTAEVDDPIIDPITVPEPEPSYEIGSVQGYVYGFSDGSKVVELHPKDIENLLDYGIQVDVTDSNGSFGFYDIPDGEYQIFAYYGVENQSENEIYEYVGKSGTFIINGNDNQSDIYLEYSKTNLLDDSEDSLTNAYQECAINYQECIDTCSSPRTCQLCSSSSSSCRNNIYLRYRSYELPEEWEWWDKDAYNEAESMMRLCSIGNDCYSGDRTSYLTSSCVSQLLRCQLEYIEMFNNQGKSDYSDTEYRNDPRLESYSPYYKPCSDSDDYCVMVRWKQCIYRQRTGDCCNIAINACSN